MNLFLQCCYKRSPVSTLKPVVVARLAACMENFHLMLLLTATGELLEVRSRETRIRNILEWRRASPHGSFKLLLCVVCSAWNETVSCVMCVSYKVFLSSFLQRLKLAISKSKSASLS